MLQHAQNVPDRAGELVVGFLAGDPQAREALPRDLGEPLVRILSRGYDKDLACPGLPNDEGDDVAVLATTRRTTCC